MTATQACNISAGITECQSLYFYSNFCLNNTRHIYLECKIMNTLRADELDSLKKYLHFV